MDGGELVARTLEAHGVRFLFTLCGGHISPILVGAKRRGIRVVDVRHEVNAVFAADAVARLTGVPGVAAVTAGPGVTNTITAVKNAQLAQSPVVLLGGATATILEGRGSLQDIDQLALFAPHVKWSVGVRRFKDLVPALERAFAEAASGVPGPVFVECPVDLLYGEEVVRGFYGVTAEPRNLGQRFVRAYLNRHLNRLFAGAERVRVTEPEPVAVPDPPDGTVAAAWRRLRRAERPVILVGSQATLVAGEVDRVAAALGRLGAPVYCSGMARGLLGRGHPLQLRHRRKAALKRADLVILAGVPCDFRLDYGRHIPRRAALVSFNRSSEDLVKNRRPALGVLTDAGRALVRLAELADGGERWADWLAELKAGDAEREEEIRAQADAETDYVNPIALCRALDGALADDSVLVADGGDFVATASYTTSPRGPLSWLDPGVFGTLGVGAGFALGAKLCRPEAEVWILYGDGSAAYSLAEFDTFLRHELPVLAVVGNDASWAQIAREQVEVLGDDVGTVLRRSDYHVVAQGYGAKGFRLERADRVEAVLEAAKREAADGNAVLVNALIGRTDFRKGSISM